MPKRRRFDGSDYVPPRDDDRLDSQYVRVWNCMVDGEWRSLPQISSITGDPPASVSAQLRHMRKPRFGSHTINKRYVANGLFEYQLVVRRTMSNTQTEMFNEEEETTVETD